MIEWEAANREWGTAGTDHAPGLIGGHPRSQLIRIGLGDSGDRWADSFAKIDVTWVCERNIIPIGGELPYI